MAKKRSKKRRKSYRGYGNPLRIYSGYGKVKVSLGIMLPSLVGGAGALGGTLLLRALVPPQVKENNVPVTNDDGTPKMSVFWKYAGLFGAGMGVVLSAILGPFQGWGAAVAGGITSIAAGLTAQFANMVVPEESRALAQYGRMGAIAATPVRRGTRMNTMPRVMSGMNGLGLIASQDKVNQPGRTGMFFPKEVLMQANPASWGQGNTGMGF